jgi:hypothetical protein
MPGRIASGKLRRTNQMARAAVPGSSLRTVPVSSGPNLELDPATFSTRDVLSMQRTIGNHAVARLLAAAQVVGDNHRTVEPSSTGKAARERVQRLIVIGDSDPSPGRMVAVHNLKLRFPGQKIVNLNAVDLGELGSGEMLYISAHGSPDRVGDLDPAGLAALLLDRGLKTGTSIDLKSCSTAVLGDSYVQKLEAQIRSQSGGKVIVLIQGYTSTHVITAEGGSKAKDPTLNQGARRQEYLAIFAAHKAEWEAAEDYIDDATRRGDPLEDIARKVAAMTKDMFQELYAHNETVAKDDAQAKGTSSVAALRLYLNEFIAASLRSMDPLWGDELVLDLIREQERAKWGGTPASYMA